MPASKQKPTRSSSRAAEFSLTIERLKRRAEESRAYASQARMYLLLVAAVAMFLLLYVAVGGGAQIAGLGPSPATVAANTNLKKSNDALNGLKKTLANLEAQQTTEKGLLDQAVKIRNFAKDNLEIARAQKSAPSAGVAIQEAKLQSQKRVASLLKEVEALDDLGPNARADLVDAKKRSLKLNEYILEELQGGRQDPTNANRIANARLAMDEAEAELRQAELRQVPIASEKASLSVRISEAEQSAQRAAIAAEKAAVEDAEIEKARQSGSVTEAITRIATTAGAIGIAILLMQVFISTNRYYSRLAEDYDAQADAFLASGDNSQLAVSFIASMSPSSIDFGKAPTTLYEKAIDALAGALKTTRGG